MDISIDSLLPFDALRKDLDEVLSIVEKNGKVVLLKDNRPAYILLKYEYNQEANIDINQQRGMTHTLQEAMKIVLLEAESNTMHASDLADEIFNRRLYLKKNGEKAEYTQIRARCSHYPKLFETLPGNYIKLKEETKV